jgi:hypothetical protein
VRVTGTIIICGVGDSNDILVVVEAMDGLPDVCGLGSGTTDIFDDDREGVYSAEETALGESARAVHHGGVVILSVVLPLNGSYVSSPGLAFCNSEVFKVVVVDTRVGRRAELGVRPPTKLESEYMMDLDARGAGPWIGTSPQALLRGETESEGPVGYCDNALMIAREEPPVVVLTISCFSEYITEIDGLLLYSELVGASPGRPEPYCINSLWETALDDPIALYCLLLESLAFDKDATALGVVGYTVVYSVTYTHSMAVGPAMIDAGFAVVLALQLSTWRGCRAPLTRATRKMQ